MPILDILLSGFIVLSGPAVFLQAPAGGDVAHGCAPGAALLGIAPQDPAEIDRDIIYRKLAVGAGSGHLADHAIEQSVRHEPDLAATGPADFDDDLVEMGAGRAGQGQFGCGLVQQFGKAQLGKINALGRGAAGAAGGARYPLADIQVEIDDLDPARMPAVGALAFNAIESDKCVKTHGTGSLQGLITRPRTPDQHKPATLPQAEALVGDFIYSKRRNVKTWKQIASDSMQVVRIAWNQCILLRMPWEHNDGV